MKYIIVLLVISFFNLRATAQSDYKIAGQSIPQLQSKPILELKFPTFHTYQNTAIPEVAPALSVVFKNYTPIAGTSMPKAWAYEELAFFCKIEVQMEKTAKLPVKFRIGEVQQVEKMEGKLKSY